MADVRTIRARRSWVVYLVVFGLSVLATTWLSSLMVSARNSERAADRAAEQARAQASIVADQRAAQSRRIDALSDQLAQARDDLRAQAVVVGRQEQAIRDLAAQVQRLGGHPVATSVAPEPAATGKALPTTSPTTSGTTSSAKAGTSKPSSKPTAKPQPSPTSQPTPNPHDGGPLGVCALLPPLC